MMKDKLKFISNYKKEDNDIVLNILKNKKIEELDKYLNVQNENVKQVNSFDFYNMKKGVEKLLQSLDNNEKIGILIDGDADGFSSAAMMYKVLNYLKANVILLTMDRKAHGIKDSISVINENKDIDLLITPDSSSNDFDTQKYLSSIGMSTLIIDHHDIDNQDTIKTTPSIIINNQVNFNNDTNYNFVGAGMVYKFIEALSSYVDVGNLEEFLPLFALGQIADMSDISDLEIRKLMLQGFYNMQYHPFFSDIFTDVQIKKLTSHKLAFELIPKINAVSRIGDIEQRLELVKVFSEYYNENILLDVERRRKNAITGKMEKKILKWSKYDLELDNITKIKSKQDSQIKKNLEKLDYISEKNDGLVIAKMDKNTNRSLSGLIANKIISKYEVPAFVISDNDKTFSGSMRCPGSFEFRSWLNDTGIVNSQGHEQAAGVEFSEDNLEKLLSKTKELDIARDYYNVDLLYNNSEVNVNDIEKINNNIGLFGGKISEPSIGFTNIPISKKYIKFRGKVVTFIYHNLTFIMYNGTQIKDWLLKTGFETDFYFDIYGTPSVNDWGNRTTQQIVIKDIAIRDTLTENSNEEASDVKESSYDEELLDLDNLIF